MPQNVTVNQRIYTGSLSCILYVGWNPPMNVAQDDVSHYTIYINGTNILNKTTSIHQNLILTAYPVCTCAEHQVRVGAVDHCGREGQRSSSITPDQDPFLSAIVNECEFVTPSTNPDTGKYIHILIQSMSTSIPLCIS